MVDRDRWTRFCPGQREVGADLCVVREVWRKSIQFSKTPLPDVRAENDLAGRVKKIPSRRRTGRTTVGVGCAITFLLMLGLDPRPI